MKVALVSYSYPNVMLGGSSWSTYNLASSLAQYVDITVVIPDLDTEKLINLEKKANSLYIPTLRIPGLRSPSFMFFAARRLRREKFDLIHSNGGAGAFMGSVDVETFRHLHDEWVLKLHSIPQLFTLRKAARVIAVSERAKQELLRLGIPEHKVSVVPNSIDTDLFTPNGDTPDSIRDRLEAGADDEKLILHVNTEVSHRKNLPLIWKTLLYFKKEGIKARLLIIGPRAKKEGALRQAVAAGLPPDSVCYLHDIPMKEMPCYYRAADFLVVPSLKEGFGRPFLESIAVGKPFVSTDVGIAAELANHGFGLIARDEKDFMEKCLQMATKPIEIGAEGHAFIQENYTWDVCARKTLEVYERVLRNKRGK